MVYYFLSDGLLLNGLFNLPGSVLVSLVGLVATADLVTLVTGAVTFSVLLLSADFDLLLAFVALERLGNFDVLELSPLPETVDVVDLCEEIVDL